MNTKITLVAGLAIALCTAASAQVFVPDNNFEAYLEDNGHSDGVPGNNFVSANVANRISLNISGLGIADLTGLEFFTSLEYLNVSNNPGITNTGLNFAWFPDTLRELYLSNIGLTSLPNITAANLSPNLAILDVSRNAITSVSIPQLGQKPPIRELYLNHNLLTSLNVSRLSATLEILNCSNNNLSGDNALVLNNPLLEQLFCDTNAIATLDVSSSPNLSFLSANGNVLTTVNLNSNTVLRTLQVANNNLATLNLAANTQLQNVDCQGNDLTSLNVLANTQLQALNASTNQLTGFLVVSQHPNLTTFDATANSSLLCIQVADEADANAGTGQFTNWNKDPGTSYSETCALDFPYTLIPDPSFEMQLINKAIDTQGVLDGRVLTADVAGLATLNVSSAGITDLTGIQDFAALQTLIVASNLLTSLDVSQASNLQTLQCGLNDIGSLDLSANPNLVQLYADGNRLTSLDLSANPNLTSLRVQTQDTGFLMSSLTLPAGGSLAELRANGNDLGPLLDVSGKPSLTTFNASNNPNLSCIQVDDAAAANAGAGQYAAWQKDGTASYFEAGDGSSCAVLVPVELMAFTVE